MKFKVGDKVKIIKNIHGHKFKIGEEVTIIEVNDIDYKAKNKKTCWWIIDKEITKIKSNKMTTKSTTDPRIGLIQKTMDKLLKANNTVTTLEIKTELRTTHPYYRLEQQFISDTVREYATNKGYSFTDNGTFRTYSAAIPTKTKDVSVTSNILRISRKKALELMKGSKGQFMTVEFTKKDGSNRVLNGQYMKDQKESQLGHVLFKESSKLKANKNSSKKPERPIRNVNMQTLKSLRIKGQTYKIRH